MATYVALLYSVVLSPRKRVAMADLREMAKGLGLKNVRTLISSGNLVFEAQEESVATLEGRLEAAFEKTFGRPVAIIVRTAEAFRRLAQGNPFPVESQSAPDLVAVRIMRAPVPPDAMERLRRAAAPHEKFILVAGDPWIVFARSTPISRLLAAIGHKSLGIGTARNWNTVRRLAEMLAT
jgi:uncharacterized protein (DUF1697 family)